MLGDLAHVAHRHLRVGEVAPDLVQLAQRTQLRRGFLVALVGREAEREAVAEQPLGDGSADALVRAGDEGDPHTLFVPD